MKKVITSEVVVAYSQCPLKAFHLLFEKKMKTSHEYVQIIEQRRRAAERECIKALKEKSSDVQLYSTDNLKKKRDFLINATLKAETLEASCAALTKVEGSSSLGRYSYEPTITVGTYNVTEEQKIEIGYVGQVLGLIQGKFPEVGRIVTFDQKSHKVKLDRLNGKFRPVMKRLKEWILTSSSEIPPLILNKHCPQCQFQSECREQAEKEDNLSLLGRMTPKLIQRYHKKGIFTVNQLSYIFKPRRKRKRKKSQLNFKPEIQALAIRAGKIYIQELPQLERHPVELFLDIEGIPDQNLDYLIGLLVREQETSIYYSFWADTILDEEKIWRGFLEKVNNFPEAPIYHYGSYERKVLDRVSKKYQIDSERLKAHLVNINSYIYSKIYFPVHSNNLKDIGNFFGANWTSPDASGLQSLVWRYHWEETSKTEYKQRLITYNEDDCQALHVLADQLSKIGKNADSQDNVDFVNRPKQRSTDRGSDIHGEFEHILRSAHYDYNRKRISIRAESNKKEVRKKRGAPKGHQAYQRIFPQKARTVIEVEPRKECPKDKNHPLRESRAVSEKIIIDLHFSQNGCRKRVLKYVGKKMYCKKCDQYYLPLEIKELKGKAFGQNFQAWIVYQRIALRLPYQAIIQVAEDLFNEGMSSGIIIASIRRLGKYYLSAEQASIQRILENPFIHADETKINIQGTEQFVWVFTDGKHIVFKKTETREATIVHEFLSGYTGVLISDFYPGYDSVSCRQQKCWSHLIGDINEDLWKEPYNKEFELFVLEVRNLIVPIIQAVEKFGLKKRNLNKFKKSVDRFYKKNIDRRDYKFEVTIKYQKRFQRYRESLFTFLEEDGIPWNNNMAERALRHLAVQRKISGTFFDSLVSEYLLLLGVAQTCRFQNKPFLKFLLSQKKDVDQFRAPKPRKYSKSVGSSKSKE